MMSKNAFGAFEQAKQRLDNVVDHLGAMNISG
jgi:hypothetical protein